MCGIVGWIDFEGQSSPESEIKAMAEAIRHRGPDDEGYVVLNHVGLGHKRLSIIDLSTNARQPMSNSSGSLWLVFNGEIYNYKALRDKLIAKGYQFQSSSDTEVILYAYDDAPDSFLNSLEGMFAFALYDRNRERLIIARDRFGKKPLYYTVKSGRFFGFASEIKALLTKPQLKPEIDPEGIRYFLELGFIPADKTPFKDVFALPAGYCAILNSRNGEWLQPPAPYWDIQFKPGEITGKALVLEKFEELMTESIQKRLQADVPVGVLLSGGLDSSLVTSVTRKCIGQDEPLHSFSIGFDFPEMDESSKARTASQAFKTIHHEFICSDQDYIEILPEALKQVDSLFTEQFVPMYLVSKLAREHVTVVLSGDGADEVLGGYNSYANVSMFEKLRNIPGFTPISQFLLGYALHCLKQPELKRKLSRVERMISVPKNQGYLAYRYSNMLGQDLDRMFSKDSSLRELLESQVHPFEMLSNRLAVPDGIKGINYYLYLDLKTSLAQQILMKSDLMSMLHGLELRCPFLDSRLVSFLFSLPLSFKHSRGESKWILREYLRDKLPKEIWGQKKFGFSAPFGYWLRSRPEFFRQIQALIESLNGKSKRLGLDEAYIETLLEEHKRAVSDNSQRISSLMVLLAWFVSFEARESVE